MEDVDDFVRALVAGHGAQRGETRLFAPSVGQGVGAASVELRHAVGPGGRGSRYLAVHRGDRPVLAPAAFAGDCSPPKIERGVLTALAPELVAPYATDMCRRDVRNALRSLRMHDDATLGDAVRLAQSFVRSVPTDVLQAT
jgi:hypothetical protein